MISNCPFCGFQLSRQIKYGIKLCSHCNAIFETTHINKLLSAAWFLRKSRNVQLEQFKFFYDLTDEESDMLYKLVIEEGFTHDEVLSLIDDYCT